MHRVDDDGVPAGVRELLVERFRGNPVSTGIALAAAEEVLLDEGALDDLARSWHHSRVAQSEAAAALAGAIAAIADRYAEETLSLRTGVPNGDVHALGGRPEAQR